MFWMAIAAGLPGVVATAWLVAIGDYSLKLQLTVALAVIGIWLGFSLALRERVVRPLQTLSNLIASLREGDYSIRGRGAFDVDALGEVLQEINALGDRLRADRFSGVEAGALLTKVIDTIDVAVLAFDPAQKLAVVNRAGEQLLRWPARFLLGKDAASLGLGELLEGETPRTVEGIPATPSGPWELRRTEFRQEGLPHSLVVLADLRRARRDEERLAWQRMVRVLSHEINNSLAPIHSIATGLRDLLERSERPEEWKEDVSSGLEIVARRSDALARFMAAYARLAKLPPPRFASIEVGEIIRRVARLESRLAVRIEPGPACVISADADQLEQLLINLVRNAVDAAAETGGEVRIYWTVEEDCLNIFVLDGGRGLSDTANLFVPFFTTKPEGTGIGLPLSRQIAEAHRGSLSLKNRPGGHGCIARLQLPLPARADRRA